MARFIPTSPPPHPCFTTYLTFTSPLTLPLLHPTSQSTSPLSHPTSAPPQLTSHVSLHLQAPRILPILLPREELSKTRLEHTLHRSTAVFLLDTLQSVLTGHWDRLSDQGHCQSLHVPVYTDLGWLPPVMEHWPFPQRAKATLLQGGAPESGDPDHGWPCPAAHRTRGPTLSLSSAPHSIGHPSPRESHLPRVTTYTWEGSKGRPWVSPFPKN